MAVKVNQNKQCPACKETLHIFASAIEIQCVCGAVWDIYWTDGDAELIDPDPEYLDSGDTTED